MAIVLVLHQPAHAQTEPGSLGDAAGDQEALLDVASKHIAELVARGMERAFAFGRPECSRSITIETLGRVEGVVMAIETSSRHALAKRDAVLDEVGAL